MKSSFIPQVRVEPELRAELEALLNKGETLSEFVEAAVRTAAESRRVQGEFLARGQASWEEVQRTGMTHSVDEVLAKLRQMTADRRTQVESRRTP